MGSIYISWVIAREWDMTYLPNIAGVVKWWSVQVETAKHSATRCLLNGTFTTHNFVVKWLQYCTISINSNVTHHTQFFLTPDLIFSRFFRFSEIFRKRGKVTCCSNWTKWYSMTVVHNDTTLNNFRTSRDRIRKRLEAASRTVYIMYLLEVHIKNTNLTRCLGRQMFRPAP